MVKPLGGSSAAIEGQLTQALNEAVLQASELKVVDSRLLLREIARHVAALPKLPPGTPMDTETAILAEVARLRRLPPDELELLARKYTDPEPLFAALDALDGTATLILRASWLKTLRPEQGDRLPKRGDPLPPEAVITVKELREITAATRWDESNGRGCMNALPVIALSHFWRTKEHPDPDGETLALVVKALNENWNDFQDNDGDERILGVGELGVLIDWCALYQSPRSEEEQRVFGQALKGINLWYAHKGTTVWLVTAGTDRVKGLGYWDKGWTSFEFALTMVIKVANFSRVADWPQVLDLGADGTYAQATRARPPPTEPLAFCGGHEHGARTYTNGADRDAIVAPTFRQTMFELLAGAAVLDFSGLNWMDEGVVQLCVVLPLCVQLERLNLWGNKVGDVGAAALAEWLSSSPPKLTTLSLQSQQSAKRIWEHKIGDEGAAALAGALRANSVLQVLGLGDNKIGDQGAAALAEVLKVNSALTTLYLGGNVVGDEGAAKLAGALEVNSVLHKLELGRNEIGEEGGAALTHALKVNSVAGRSCWPPKYT